MITAECHKGMATGPHKKRPSDHELTILCQVY
jgi:hypothetical protein